MRRSKIAALGLVLLAGAGLVAWQAATGAPGRLAADLLSTLPGASSGPGGGQARAGGAVAVEAAATRTAAMADDIPAIGSLRSDESVEIAAEIPGRIVELPFREGEAVRKGEVLVRLDDALARAELADAAARLVLAEANNARAKRLSRSGAGTEKAADEALAAFDTARAALELQKVRVEKHSIEAPFDGRVGLRRFSPGSFAAVAEPIVNLEKIDVLKVDFKLPETELGSVAVGQPVEVAVDAIPGRTFPGEIYAIDPQVDVGGRALRLRARLPNPGLVLRPGLFARILVRGKETREVVMAPEAAIVLRGGESYVFAIENGKAVERKVELGERANGEVAIQSGIGADTLVVTAGQLKLRNGSDVEVVTASAAEDARKGGT